MHAYVYACLEAKHTYMQPYAHATFIHATFITFTNGKNQNKISDYVFAEERKVKAVDVGVVRCTCT